MKDRKVDMNKLKSIKNYADSFGVTASYIYKLEREGKMDLFQLDGVKFVDTIAYPSIPVVKRRK